MFLCIYGAYTSEFESHFPLYTLFELLGCYAQCDFHFIYLSQHVRLESGLNPPMPSGYTFQTLFNPNKTVVKMFVVMYDLRAMPAGHQTFLRQRTFSVPVRRDTNNHTSRKPLGQGRTLRYLVHLR